MSSDPHSLGWLHLRLLGVALLVVLAVTAGLWLGGLSAPKNPLLYPEETREQPPSTEADAATAPRENAPPLYFFPALPPNESWAAVAEEIALSAAAGVHQYVVPVALPWSGEPADVGRLESLSAMDPKSSALLYVALDPPKGWLEKHPEDGALVGSERLARVSFASERWL
ncbi:MAG TPA: hypothetical protein ENN80_04845, partial [Candidatus Hydrogenedentes bacterium]|nr:hypothetical protein [Candidatus Hydrogenedentota bacterium]